jgi:ankyrin repeat protein
MSRTTRILLALGLSASLPGCGWLEKGKEKARRRAFEDETIAAAKAGDLATLKERLSRDPSLAKAVERSYRQRGRPNEVGTMLTAGVSSGRPDVVELLLDAGVDPNGSGADRRATPLHAAAALKVADGAEVRIAELLLARGARLEPIDDSGQTPVHALLNRGGDEAARLPLLRLFLSRPGATEVRDGEGKTPLHFVAYFRRKAPLEALIFSGADPNAKVTTMPRNPGAVPIDGETPLHSAVRGSEGSGRADGIFELCAAGADPSIRNDAGKTPEDLARDLLAARKGQPSASPALLHAGESLAAVLAPGGACATWLARFRAGGRPESFAPVRLAQREYNCAAGDDLDCQELGKAYEEGDGVEKDLGKALAYFTRSCEAKSAWSCSMVGSFHASGRGVAEDLAEASRWFERACDGGHGWSCNRLGEMVRDGEGVAKDPKRALSLFEMACQAQDAKGCENGRALKAAGR